MLFETHLEDLKDLVAKARSGLIQLPDFQRGWVWDDERIAALLGTVARGFPFGVMMTMETGSGLKFRPRPLAGTEPPPDAEPEALLMDGQQRLTSLVQALASEHAVDTMDNRRKRLERYYYIDIDRAVNRPESMEEAIVSVPGTKMLAVRDDLGRVVVTDLTRQEAEVAAGLFPLRLAFDDDAQFDWQQNYVTTGDSARRRSAWKTFNSKVLKQIGSYQAPVIRITKEATKEAICAVFENVNTQGVELTVFELLTASYAASDFHLPTDWEATENKLRETEVLFNFKHTDFLRAVCLVSTHHARRGKPGVDPYEQPAASCKRSDILGLELAEYQEWSPVIIEALGWTARFLERQGFFSSWDVPYISQLSSLAAIRAVLGDQADDRAAEEKIIRWFWCGVLGEQYSGALDSRLPRDLEQVIAWVGGGREPSSVTLASFNEKRLNTMTRRTSAAYKGVCGLLLRQQCVDWTYSRNPINAAIYWEMKVDICQVFPKSWFGKDKEKGSRLDSIVNKTLLTSRTNGVMGSRHPADYLGRLESEAGLPSNWFDDVLATHLIDPRALRAEDFETFYATRSAALLRLIQDAMGRPPIDEPETLDDYEPEPVA